MAKRRKSKADEPHPLAGKVITVLARKEGEEEKQKDLVYEEALKAKKQFERIGWSVQLFQVGYYQPFNKPKI